MKNKILALAIFATSINLLAQEVEYDVPVRLGNGINTDAEEMKPVFSNGKLYFARFSGTLNVCMSEQDGDNWKPVQTKFSINNNDHNAVQSISGSNVYLLGEYGKKYNSSGLSVAKMNGSDIDSPEKVSIKGLKLKENTQYEFFVNSSEDVMLLSMYGDDTKGKEDLYAILKQDGEWQKPINLGNKVNSSGFEISPFLAQDGKTLYFSTNGRGGEGNADIFKTTRLDDSWTNWSEPVNLGKQVNSSAFDAYFVLDENGVGYFASDRGSTHSDIFMVKEKEEEVVEIDLAMTVNGKVFDEETNDPMKVELDVTDKADESFHKKLITNNDGSYSMQLEKGKEYVFNILIPKYHEVHTDFTISAEEPKNEFTNNIPMKRLKVGDDIKLGYLYFVVNQDTLREISLPEVEKLIKILQDNPEINLSIEGHTDNSGSTERNKELSLARAEAIKKILVENGIKKKRLDTVGYGSTKPLVKNITEENRKKNRRVEFKIVK